MLPQKFLLSGVLAIGAFSLPCPGTAGQGPEGSLHVYDQDCKAKTGAGWSVTVIPGGGPHRIECDYVPPQGTDTDNIGGVNLGDSLGSAINHLQSQGYHAATSYNVVSENVLFDGNSIRLSYVNIGTTTGIYIGDDTGLGEFSDYYSNPQERGRYPILETYLPFVREDKDWIYTVIIAASPVPANYTNAFYEHSRVVGERMWIKSKGLFDNSKRNILNAALGEKFRSSKYSLTDEGAKVTVAQFGYSTFIAQDVYQEASKQTPPSVQKPNF